MKWIAMIALVFSGLSANAQFSVGGGASTLFQFGNSKPFGGLHFNVEFPRNNEVTFYGRLTYHFKQNRSSTVDSDGLPIQFFVEAIDQNTVPFSKVLPATFEESFNYVMIDGGTRYYIINGYDEGFSLYGGTNVALIVNTAIYSYNVQGMTSLYRVPSNELRPTEKSKGTILNLAAGITGGAKYTMPGRGTLYFDINPSLMLFGLPSNNKIETSLYKNVIFNFNIGYRKEIY